MRTLEELKELVACGKGEIPCDWKLANVQLVNVYSREIYPTDIYIKGKRIVSIEPGIHLEARQVKDCGNLYAIPGILSPPCCRRRHWPTWWCQRGPPP